MPVESLTARVCSHSHLSNPFCPHEDLLTRIIKVVAVVIAAIAAYMIYHIWGSDNRDDPPPSPTLSPKPPEPTPLQQSPQSKSHFTPLEDQVAKIPEIVKIPLSILQRRAMPAAFGGETTRGFIQEEQSLLEVIQSNWNTARSLKIKHVEIADELRRLIEAARARPDQQKPLAYSVKTEGSDSTKKSEEIFIAQVVKTCENDIDIFRPEGVSQDVGSTNEEVVIVNTAVHKRIRWTPLREKYIRQYGFYSLGMEIENVVEVLRLRVKK